MNKKYTVFVSSTYEDLKEECQEVIQALLEMDCIPLASLSSGEDCIDIVFNIFNRGEFHFETDKLTISMSWNDILRKIGPELIEEHIRFAIEELGFAYIPAVYPALRIVSQKA